MKAFSKLRKDLTICLIRSLTFDWTQIIPTEAQLGIGIIGTQFSSMENLPMKEERGRGKRSKVSCWIRRMVPGDLPTILNADKVYNWYIPIPKPGCLIEIQ